MSKFSYLTDAIGEAEFRADTEKTKMVVYYLKGGYRVAPLGSVKVRALETIKPSSVALRWGRKAIS